jgi:hypothetical protein
MIITAVALLFSSFSSPALSALLTFFVFIIGHFSADLKTLSISMNSAAARWVVYWPVLLVTQFEQLQLHHTSSSWGSSSDQ